jgi:hypothetical protein
MQSPWHKARFQKKMMTQTVILLYNLGAAGDPGKSSSGNIDILQFAIKIRTRAPGQNACR